MYIYIYVYIYIYTHTHISFLDFNKIRYIDQSRYFHISVSLASNSVYRKGNHKSSVAEHQADEVALRIAKHEKALYFERCINAMDEFLNNLAYVAVSRCCHTCFNVNAVVPIGTPCKKTTSTFLP